MILHEANEPKDTDKQAAKRGTGWKKRPLFNELSDGNIKLEIIQIYGPAGFQFTYNVAVIYKIETNTIISSVYAWIFREKLL